MKLEEMLKQQKKRGLKTQTIKAKMQSYDEYLNDDTSPRPYNTPNVLDLVSNMNDLDVSVRDTNNDESKSSIRDTNIDELKGSIRGTNFDESKSSIRDTNIDELKGSIRGTNIDELKGSIRGTNIDESKSSIRDTNIDELKGAIRDTNIDGLRSSIRDTNIDELKGAIRGTNFDESKSSIRDTNIDDLKGSIRDTNIDDLKSYIRDTNNKREQTNILGSEVRYVGRPTKGKKYNYKDLTGNSKKLVNEIANLCVINNGYVTPFIDKVSLSINTGVKLGAIKTSICRLKDKGVLIDYEASKGRCSAWKFLLSPEILDQYLRHRKGIS